MSQHFIDVELVAKQFQKVKAVDGLSFHIKNGEIFALLGPNGAGKTTMVRMLLDIIRPDSGSICYNFEHSDFFINRFSKIGYLPEDRGLYKDVQIDKILIYMGVLHGMSHRKAAASTIKWLEKIGLKDRANDKLDSLSKGNQQKIQFISAILHNPVFAILDEPFSGLDPINQDFILEIIRDLRDSGTTILLSAHQMNLVERLADRVLLLNRGKEVLQGTIQQIKENSELAHKVILSIDGSTDISMLRNLTDVLDIEQHSEGSVAFLLRKDGSLNRFLSEVSSKAVIKAIHSDQISLHELFIRTVKLAESRTKMETDNE